jgi:hypothetical protein
MRLGIRIGPFWVSTRTRRRSRRLGARTGQRISRASSVTRRAGSTAAHTITGPLRLRRNAFRRENHRRDKATSSRTSAAHRQHEPGGVPPPSGGDRLRRGGAAPPPGGQIASIVTALGDILAVLADADPADKAEIYSQLGLRLTYQPGQRIVRAEAHLDQTPH